MALDDFTPPPPPSPPERSIQFGGGVALSIAKPFSFTEQTIHHPEVYKLFGLK